MAWIYLTIAILSEVVATSALKSTEGFTRPGATVVVVLGYLAAFFFLSLTLNRIPVGVAYAVWSGVGMVLVTAVGWLAYRQVLSVPALLGIALIVAGVIVLCVNTEFSPPANPD